MKKFLTLLLILLCLALPVQAESHVIDEADLLTDAQETTLQAQIDEIENTYRFSTVILTKNSIGSKDCMMYAADYYDDLIGKDTDGIIFLISMEYRDFCTVTSGRGLRAFTDWGIDQIHDYMLPDLRNGDYNAALQKWLKCIPQYLDQEASGNAYDDPSLYGSPKAPALLSPGERLREIAPVILIVAFMIALIVVLAMKAGMKTNRRQNNATSYVDHFNLTRVQDIYLYTTTTRRKIETNNGGGSGGHGGSTTFHSSSGGTHGGRSGKF